MSAWGPPRCHHCGQFISKEDRSGYCDGCFFTLYEQVGKIPDDQIPRSVMREWKYQQMKLQRDMLGDWQWLCEWLSERPTHSAEDALIPEPFRGILDPSRREQLQALDLVWLDAGQWHLRDDWRAKFDAASDDLKTKMTKAQAAMRQN